MESRYLENLRRLVISSITAVCLGAPGAVLSQDPAWAPQLKTSLGKMADSLTLTLKAWDVPGRVFKVEDFGAVGDSATLNTAAIQKAIDSCSAAGGGAVLLTSGNYVTGTISLKSGVMLEIAASARLLGSIKIKDYPERIEAFKSVMSENHKFRQSLIYAEKADRTGIRGKGEIYFRGEKKNFPGQQTTGEIKDRPFGIRMIECKNVVLQDIYLHNAAAWMQSYIYCQDMIFERILVVNQANFNNDGLDIDGCGNVIVRDCYINSEDDAMCLKGAGNRPTYNILIENGTFVSTCNCLKIGTDTQGDFFNIVARSVKLGGVPPGEPSIAGNQASTGITLATVDGGDAQNIMVSGVTIERTRCPIFLRIGNRGRVMPGLPKPLPGKLRRIIVENVTGSGNFRQGSLISGITGYRVEDALIRNVDLSMEGGGTAAMIDKPVPEDEGGYPDAQKFSTDGLPAYGFYIRHAKNIRFGNVRVTPVNPDARSCFKSGSDTDSIIIYSDSTGAALPPNPPPAAPRSARATFGLLGAAAHFLPLQNECAAAVFTLHGRRLYRGTVRDLDARRVGATIPACAVTSSPGGAGKSD